MTVAVEKFQSHQRTRLFQIVWPGSNECRTSELEWTKKAAQSFLEIWRHWFLHFSWQAWWIVHRRTAIITRIYIYMYILKFTFSDIDVTVSTWHPNMKFGAFKLLMAKLDATCPAWLRQRPDQTQKTPRSSAAQHRHPKKNATTWGYLCAEQHYWVCSVPFWLAKESLGTQGLIPQRRNMFTTACLQYAIQACHTINSSQYMYLYIHT